MGKQGKLVLVGIVVSLMGSRLYATECVDLDGDCINEPPICQIATERYDLPCDGRTQKILLDGGQSYDPDGDPLTFLWSETGEVLPADYRYNFRNEAVTDILFLSYGAAPSYLPLDFTLTLAVSDGVNPPVTCLLPITVEQCPVDCEGTFEGKKQLDSCGACGGDGTGCICEEQDLTSQALELDGGSRSLSATFGALVNLAYSQGVISKSKKAKLKSLSQTNYNESWKLSWGLPTKNQQCGALVACFEVSTESNSAEIDRLSSQLISESSKLVKLLKSTSRAKKAKKLSGKISQLHAQIKGLLSQRPTSIGVCETGQS